MFLSLTVANGQNLPPSAAAGPAQSPLQIPMPQPPPGQQPMPVLESTKLLVDFQKTLTEAAKNHQDFLEKQVETHEKLLEWCYVLSSGILCIIVAFGTGAVTFFHFNSKREIEKVVAKRVAEQVDQDISKAQAAVQAQIRAMKLDAEKEVEEFRSLLREKEKAIQTKVADLATTFKGDIDSIVHLVGVLAHACAVLAQAPSGNPKENERTDQERRQVLRSLEAMGEWAPTNRIIGIFRGRLHVQLGDHDAAIKALDEVLTKRNQLGKNSPEDDSALLYNKACYLNNKANNAKGEASEKLHAEAWETLKAAIRLWPQNLAEAQQDPDLEDVTGPTRKWADLRTLVVDQTN